MSSSSSDDEVGLAVVSTAKKKTRKRQQQQTKKRGRFAKKATSRVDKWGGRVLSFQDDKTGRSLLHPSALRFTMKLMEEEAQRTATTVSQSLMDSGELVRVPPIKRKTLVGTLSHTNPFRKTESWYRFGLNTT